MNKIMVFLTIIAALNLISYVSVRDWKSSMILLLAGLVSYNTQSEILLFIGILAAALFRSVLIEGFEKPESKDETKDPAPKKKITKSVTDPEPSSAPILSASYIEGLTEKSKEITNQHTNLLEMTKQIGPLMAQAESMMQKLPEGFLDAALEKFKNNK